MISTQGNWWDLKDWPKEGYYCGEDMDDDCKDWYGAMVTKAMDEMCSEANACEDFRATRAGQVDLTRGDRVICLDDSDAVWWRGSCRGRVGLFPADAVEPQS